MSIANILSLLGGVALFLFGMSLMGDGLKRVAGNRLDPCPLQCAGGRQLGVVVLHLNLGSHGGGDWHSAQTVDKVGFCHREPTKGTHKFYGSFVAKNW